MMFFVGFVFYDLDIGCYTGVLEYESTVGAVGFLVKVINKYIIVVAFWTGGLDMLVIVLF